MSTDVPAGETQACADAASERIRGLEDETVHQRTEHEAAMAQADKDREAQKAAADDALAQMLKEKTEEIHGLQTALETLQVAHPS